MIDLRSVISSFGAPLTITRRPPGEWVNGIWVAATPVDVAAGLASIQPVGDRSVVLPEGVRAEDAVTVYAQVELRGVQDPEGYAADRFDYRGRTFEVQSVRDWSTGAMGQYFKAIAYRVRDSEDEES